MKYICNSQQDLERVRLQLLSMSLDRPVEITIKKYVKNRSAAQNRLLHQWFNVIADHWLKSTGESFSPAAFKELLKRMFLGFDLVDLPDGQKVSQTKRTRDCTTKELTEFLEKIEAWAVTEIECQLPHPDDYYYLAMGFKR